MSDTVGCKGKVLSNSCKKPGVAVSLHFFLFASFLRAERLCRFRPNTEVTEQRGIGAEPLWYMAFASLLHHQHLK